MATTETASAILRTIKALETWSESTLYQSGVVIIRTMVPARLELLATKIKLYSYEYENGKFVGYSEMDFKPTAHVRRKLLASGIRQRDKASYLPTTTLAEFKEHLTLAARPEKLQALIE